MADLFKHSWPFFVSASLTIQFIQLFKTSPKCSHTSDLNLVQTQGEGLKMTSSRPESPTAKSNTYLTVTFLLPMFVLWGLSVYLLWFQPDLEWLSTLWRRENPKKFKKDDEPKDDKPEEKPSGMEVPPMGSQAYFNNIKNSCTKYESLIWDQVTFPGKSDSAHNLSHWKTDHA